MAWIELHQSLPTHRKTLEMADLLDITPVQVVGHLTCFWLWALDNTPTGNLVGVSARTIARAAQWTGEPGNFSSALWQAGFTSHDADGQLEIHDWYDYAGKLVERRATERERLREKRAAAKQQQQGVGSTLQQRTPDVVCTVPNRTLPNSTESNEETKDAEPAAPGVSPVEPDVLDWPDDAKPPAPITPLPVRTATHQPARERMGVDEVVMYHSARLHPNESDDITADDRKKVSARLKTFKVDDLKRAIDRFCQHPWYMENHSWRDASWFFHSDARIRGFLKMPLDKESPNGHSAQSSSSRSHQRGRQNNRSVASLELAADFGD